MRFRVYADCHQEFAAPSREIRNIPLCGHAERSEIKPLLRGPIGGIVAHRHLDLHRAERVAIHTLADATSPSISPPKDVPSRNSASQTGNPSVGKGINEKGMELRKP